MSYSLLLHTSVAGRVKTDIVNGCLAGEEASALGVEGDVEELRAGDGDLDSLPCGSARVRCPDDSFGRADLENSLKAKEKRLRSSL